MNNRQYFTAQSGLIDPSDASKWQVVLIGCGGLGSFIGPLVSKLGIGELHLYDFDTVEESNIGGQNFIPSEINKLKIDCVASRCIGTVSTFWERVDINTEYKLSKPTIFISAVDNMKTRQDIYHSVKNLTNARCIIDPRMGGEIGKVEYCDLLDMDSRKRYMATLHSDENSTPLPCSERATSYNAMLISSIVGYWVKNVLLTVGPPCAVSWYNNFSNNAFGLTIM
jgi:molybdopterin/thiamine biosynthesis adenylyltransferase